MPQSKEEKEKNKERDKKIKIKNGTGELFEEIMPFLKLMQVEDKVVQMPELALRCAQFFNMLSQQCVTYYSAYKREQQISKTKQIKKNEVCRRQHTRKKHKTAEKEDGITNPPKKPLTAYIIYFQEKKSLFVQRYPSLNLSEVTKLIAKEWKELSGEEQKVYLLKASEDRKRYDEEMLDFRKLHDQGLADIIYGEEREEVNGGEPSAADVIVNEQILDSIEQDEKKEKNDIILEEAESEQAEESRNIVGSGGYGEAIEDEANEAANESANGSEDKQYREGLREREDGGDSEDVKIISEEND